MAAPEIAPPLAPAIAPCFIASLAVVALKTASLPIPTVAVETAPSSAPDKPSFAICFILNASFWILFVALSTVFKPAFVAAPIPAAAKMEAPPVSGAKPRAAAVTTPVEIPVIRLTPLFCLPEYFEILENASS